MGKLIQNYATYQVAVAIAAVAAGAPICQINPPQVNADKSISMGLTRLRVILTTAVASSFGLTTAATVGTPTAPGTNLGDFSSSNNGGYSGGTSQGRLLTDWSVAPTVDGTPIYFEQDLLPATIGAGFEWTWPEDDPLTRNMSRTTATKEFGLILQNIGGGASGALLVTARWKEFPTFG